MAATPKPARKAAKSEKKHMIKAVENPKHGFSSKEKKKHLSAMMKESKSRHTKSSVKMSKFRKKHPGEVYEP